MKSEFRVKTPLSPSLRRQLERAIVTARDVAEAGARVALESLAVHEREPYRHMNPEQRALRNRLRAHGRQLGDRRHAGTGSQGIDHLVHECAYEHWHSMLFARFLAENDLLIEPNTGVAVTLEECEELAQEEGLDRWTLATRYAHRMLPQVFRPNHPAFEVQLAREHRLKLEQLVETLPTAVFDATDSLGWVYQFWQSKKKAEVNNSEQKIGADQLPAVTQLFTEPYMVRFLLDNSLGAWWAAQRLSASDLNAAASEAELRRPAALPGVPLDYLRFVQCDNTTRHPGWWPAAGAFDAWPEHLGELRILDPCCGSGHFLVAAFSMLVPMRMDREGLNTCDAVDAVLRENLHGLELDPRCVAIAAFALAVAAWGYPGAEGYRPLPELNLACSGLSVGATRERWAELAGAKRNLRLSLEWLHDAFQDAPVLGSLVNPSRTDAAELVNWGDLSAALAQALAQEPSEERREAAIAAQGLAKATQMLAASYHLVVTNVPYLARGKQDERLCDFCDRYYPTAKRDLATVFLERCLALCRDGGTASLVLPQNWLFLTSYRKLRERLLKTETWHLLARLGPGAFETISGEVVKALLLTLSRGNDAGKSSELFTTAIAPITMYGLDVSDSRAATKKADRLTAAELTGVAQDWQFNNPDARVALGHNKDVALLLENAEGVHGFGSKDAPRFFRQFWEVTDFCDDWQFLQTTVGGTRDWSGCEQAVYWQNGQGILAERGRIGLAIPAGRMAWGKSGVAVSQMRLLPSSLYTGEVFDKNVAVVLPKEETHLPAIWCFCSSPEYNDAVRRIDTALKVTNTTLVKVPFDRERWSQVGSERYPNGLPRPYSDDPTQWIFHGHPCGSVVWDDTYKRTDHGPLRTDATVLQVAVARLLGYHWPAEQDAEMELATEQREWVQRCEALCPLADEDGIVCISPVRGEASAGERLLSYLAVSFGDAWNDAVLTGLLTAVGTRTLDDWLRHRFFEQHCKLFHQRPFVWHIWDGRRDGFHALVNYHKLTAGDGKGRQLLESLTYSYLGDWISRQRDGVTRGDGGAEGRWDAALELQKRLIAITNGEPPFDIFIRWKSIDQQPIGWAPDINDGVRINIRPFMADDIPGGKKGAGILRSKPSIHWRKDRGREPVRDADRFPWLCTNGEFTGDRVNNVHMTVTGKSNPPEFGFQV